MLLHAQDREFTGDLDLVKVARNFIDANDKRKKYFGPADYILAILKHLFLYIHLTERILQFTIFYYLLASTAGNLSSKHGMILIDVYYAVLN